MDDDWIVLDALFLELAWWSEMTATRIAFASIALSMALWWIAPRTEQFKSYDIQYIRHVLTGQNEEITYNCEVVTQVNQGTNYRHPWLNLAWLVRWTNPHEEFFSTLAWSIGLVILCFLFSESVGALWAITFLSWSPVIFHVVRSVNAEPFFMLVNAICLYSVVRKRLYWLSIPAFCFGIYIHPVGILVGPPYLIGLALINPLLSLAAVTAALYTVNHFVDFSNFVHWNGLYRALAPLTRDYAWPVIYMKGSFLFLVNQFFSNFGYITGFDAMWTRVALRLVCFAALMWQFIRKGFTDRRALFCLCYCIASGFGAPCPYTHVTDPFLIAGGIAVLYAIL